MSKRRGNNNNSVNNVESGVSSSDMSEVRQSANVAEFQDRASAVQRVAVIAESSISAFRVLKQTKLAHGDRDCTCYTMATWGRKGVPLVCDADLHGRCQPRWGFTTPIDQHSKIQAGGRTRTHSRSHDAAGEIDTAKATTTP